MQGNSHTSILALFLEKAVHSGSATAALVPRDGIYQKITWQEIAAESLGVSAGLKSLGIQPGDRVCILSGTRLEWVVADLGIMGVGAVTVGIYPSSSADDICFIIHDSGAVAVFVEDDYQAELLLTARTQLKNLNYIIQIEGTFAIEMEGFLTWDSLIQSGSISTQERFEGPPPFTEDSILTILYTSGTSGCPKGVVLTHGNLLFTGRAISETGIIRSDDVHLLFLPLAHSFGRALEVAWFQVGHIMAFAEGMDSLQKNFQEVNPTFFCGVPIMFEKIHATVLRKGVSRGGLRVALFQKACFLSQKNAVAEMKGKRLAWYDRLVFLFLKHLILKKIGRVLLSNFGGRLRLMGCGGAPLPPGTFAFFRDSGLSILEGYGLTETSGVACINLPNQSRIGSVGTPLTDVEIRIADDGEIWIKSPGNLKEYWRNSQESNAIFAGEWLRTGDIGEMDSSGYLMITDRKNDLIVTSTGKKIAPQKIENHFKQSPFISQILVYGKNRKFLSALLTLDPEYLSHYRGKNFYQNGSIADSTRESGIFSAVQWSIDKLNRDLAPHERVRKFKILDHEFSQEHQEITPTAKIKRNMIFEKYKSVFEKLYD